MKIKNLHSKIDKVGAMASALCAVHCLICPIFLSILPLLGLAFLADHKVEMAFISISGLLAMLSLCWGVRKHKKFSILGVASAGFALLAIGHMFEENPISIASAVLGGLVICLSHLINYKLCQTCYHCH